ncbi:MAG TPA: ABC transporter permease, partial [Bacteroidota bacterium]
MLRLYFLTSLRRFSRQRAYTLINVLGLTLGIASCLLIFLYVAYELGFDRFLAHADRIVRIETAGWATTPMAVGPFLQETRPEVERSARFLRVNRALVGSDQQMFSEKRFFFADSTVFALFSVPFLEGEPSSALTTPNALVLTRT